MLCVPVSFPSFSANRAVEVNEMWRVRQKELELNDRLKGGSKKDTSHSWSYGDTSNSSRRTSGKHESDFSASCSSSKRPADSSRSREDDEGLRDEEIEEFLQSRFVPLIGCNFISGIYAEN